MSKTSSYRNYKRWQQNMRSMNKNEVIKRNYNQHQKPFWLPEPELAKQQDQYPLTFNFDMRLQKTLECPNWKLLEKCRMGDKCKFAHGEEEKRVLSEEDRLKFTCRSKQLTTCRQTRLVCVYFHEHETEFKTTNFQVKKNIDFSNRKVVYGNPPYKKKDKFVLPLEDYPLPVWMMKILQGAEQLDPRDVVQQLKRHKIVQKDIMVKSNAIRKILDEQRDYKMQFEFLNGSYKKQHHNLLYIEEFQTKIDLRQYDLHKINIIPDSKVKNLVKIRVPGIAEKRPNVLRGDRIYILKSKLENNFEIDDLHIGYVHFTDLEHIQVSLDQSLNKDLNQDVSFGYNRTIYKLMHRSVDMFEIFFKKLQFNDNTPASAAVKQPGNILNTLQSKVVTDILESSSQIHIIQGPPGTGKTHNLMELVKILFQQKRNIKVLLTAPSNYASDLLCSRLSEFVDKNKLKMMRINPPHRDPKDLLTFDIVKYCQQEGFGQNKNNPLFRDGKVSFWQPELEEIKDIDIAVTTCVSAGQVQSIGVNQIQDYILIDEAGEAMEQEVFIPLQNSNASTRIVLAGDHNQLGPIVRSDICIKLGMEVSILERSIKQFKSQITTTALEESQRAHPRILNLYNQIFQQKVLKPNKPDSVEFKQRFKSVIGNSAAPVRMFHTETPEENEEGSPSFQNQGEVQVVRKLLIDLLVKDNINLEDIGIITPQRKQEEKLKKMIFALHKFEKLVYRGKPLSAEDVKLIKLGTVETFQGQERDVVIVSVVRSDPNNLKHDRRFKLGFMDNYKRMNVAVSRAKELLLIVGNVKILETDKSWSQFLTILTKPEQANSVDMVSFKDGVPRERTEVREDEKPKEVEPEKGEEVDIIGELQNMEKEKIDLMREFNQDYSESDDDSVAGMNCDKPFRGEV